MGAHGIELDIVISKDDVIVVSHEPWMNAEVCYNENGHPLEEAKGLEYNIRAMTYDSIAKFDCGSKPHPDFEEQERIKSFKPKLSDVFKAVESYVESEQLPKAQYLIELKYKEAHVDYYPDPQEYVEIVDRALQKWDFKNRIVIMSYSTDILKRFRRIKDRDYKLGFVVSNGKGVELNMRELGFIPDFLLC